MSPDIISVCKEFRRINPLKPGRVLEIGSMDVNGTIRAAFPDATEYVGVDMAEGIGVDVVLDVDKSPWPFESGLFDTVLCCETLEHMLTPWETVGYMRDALKHGGHMFISTPAYGFPYHAYPKDYYRFTEDTYRELFFAGMEILGLDRAHDEHPGWQAICCLGRKP